MDTEYTEFVYVAEDGSFYREAEVRSWDTSSDSLPEVILIPTLLPNAPYVYDEDGWPHLPTFDRVYRREEIKSPLPLTNEGIAEIITHRREMAGQSAAEPNPASSWDWEYWDWEEPD